MPVQGGCAMPLLGLRGGGTRNKWRRKQNQNRGTGAGYGAHRVPEGNSAKTGRRGAGEGEFQRGAEGTRFHSRWNSFRGFGRGGVRYAHMQASEDEDNSFATSREVDSEGNEVIYVDSQGNEIPASQVDSDDSNMGESSGDFIFVDEDGNPVGGSGGSRLRSPPPGAVIPR